MIKKSFIVSMFYLLWACADHSESTTSNIEQQVEGLGSLKDKQKFLEQIYEDDQKVRDGKDAALMLKYGKDSEEHMAYIKAQWQQDAINLIKVESYLKNYGYPSKAALGKVAALAPWLVIHHATDLQIRNRYFDSLHQAYLHENIEASDFSLYLGRTYAITFGEQHQMESPYRYEDEINQLIKKLDLEVP